MTDATETLAVEAPRANILLVDDRPANLTALEAILEPLGDRLVKASSGEEALWRLLREEFAVVLLDVQMPGLDGFQVASLIRERAQTRHLPIIFLTAISRDSTNVFRGYEHGAVDYLVKPFDPVVLRSKVTVLVDLHKKGKVIEQQAELLRQRERETLERRSEQRFRGLLDCMPGCVWSAGPDGIVQYANRGAREVTPAGDAVSLLEVVHREDWPGVEATWRRALMDEEAFEMEARLQQQGGEEQREDEWRWHLVRGVAEHDEAGTLTGWIISATDIDDRKRAEERLLATERELRQANEAKDAFVAAASHELRTPLAAAKGQAQLALMKLGTSSSGEFPGKAFASIVRQVDRMAKLVSDMLDLSRIQAGRLSLEIERFEFADLLREVHERMQVTTSEHEVVVEVSEPLQMVADRGRLDQVVTNLISNAIRYSPEGGRVVVQAGSDGDDVHVSVRDHGLGIPPEKQALIFERFGRAHGVKYGGLGLGLTITAGIVLQHGGRLWVESTGTPGEGSVFHVSIPRRATLSPAANVAERTVAA